MIFIRYGAIAPEFVARVQRFRGEIYLAEGAIQTLIDGRHIEAEDEASLHIVSTDEESWEIRACIRYQRMGKGIARIGGWVVDPTRHGNSRESIRLVLECLRLAERLGDHYGTATATRRNNSAGILKRLGGRELMSYFDAAYGCEMELLEFRLDEMKSGTARAENALLAA